MRKQHGVALITVMLIVALTAILATQMNSRLLLQMQRTTNIALNQQAYWYAMGAEAFAKRALLDIFKKEPDSTNLAQPWAQGKTTYPVDDGSITGEIIDLQACLNLNALRAETRKKKKTPRKSPPSTKNVQLPAKKALIELLIALNIEGVSQFEAEYMADALTDWLDDDSALVSAGGAEDNDYAAKEFAYLPANNYLASVNELRIVENFTVPAIEALKDYVCVLPNSALFKININTIPVDHALLLQALLGISLSDAQQVLAARKEKGFKTVDDFFNSPELRKTKIAADIKQSFVVDSEYFKLKTTASFNGSFFSLNSVMKIENNKTITVLSRTIGQ